MVDPEPGPSLEDQENALPKRDKIVQICQSDEMFTWMHALATILVINEKAFSGGPQGVRAAENVAGLDANPQAACMDFRPLNLGADGSGHDLGRGNDSSSCNGYGRFACHRLGGWSQVPHSSPDHRLLRLHQLLVQTPLGSG